MPAWNILNPDDSVEWSGHAEDEIAALDAWVEATMTGMSTYSDTIRFCILDGQESTPVYRHEGVIHAVHTNYEVRVVPRGREEPINRLTIGYRLNGEVGQHTTEVGADHDLEKATRELQLLLVGEILKINPWVESRQRVQEDA